MMDPSISQLVAHNYPLTVRYLGRQPYLRIWQQMKDFTEQRTVDTVDELWLVEHEPVFTQGQAGRAEHVLLPKEIPVVQTDRGGQVTYHGPGQLILYVLLDIRRHRSGPRALVTILEQSVIQLLMHYGITAYSKADAPGVYVKEANGVEAKIASLGLRFRKHCSYHGVSLNVSMDLEPFSRINPCGYAGLAVTDMATLLSQKVDITAVGQQLLGCFQQAFSSDNCD